ncbi:hypothetical protein BRADI_3g37700v3 [Brachypodium distachyon]|uniref:RWP-RK domain-containing protein n=1 Tax=Brachypodium distachyon TaxID=15368 RepID=I1I7N7_BRADI|nr:hypothetical protein BRADI_3g37700v3 [Brachypodium distachyon]
MDHFQVTILESSLVDESNDGLVVVPMPVAPPATWNENPHADMQHDKGTIVEQHERDDMLDEILRYLHLPMVEAAKELKMTPKALKHLSRRHGINPWPTQRIKATNKNITKLLDAGTHGNNKREASIQFKNMDLEKNKEEMHEKIATQSAEPEI